MSNQVDVKFRLKQRKAKGSQSGNLTTENVLITMRVKADVGKCQKTHIAQRL